MVAGKEKDQYVRMLWAWVCKSSAGLLMTGHPEGNSWDRFKSEATYTATRIWLGEWLKCSINSNWVRVTLVGSILGKMSREERNAIFSPPLPKSENVHRGVPHCYTTDVPVVFNWAFSCLLHIKFPWISSSLFSFPRLNEDFIFGQ